MKHCLLTFSLLFAVGCSSSLKRENFLPSKKVGHVLIVSIDGGKPSVIDEVAMPVLKNLATEGSATWNAQTIDPSLTLPSHTSMLTGVGPAKHSILWNEWEPDRGLVKVPTIFSVAHEAGLSTMMVVGKKKFRHLELPATLDHFEIVEKGAVEVAREAAKQIVSLKPRLAFVHFKDADEAGHLYGWGSVEQKQALVNVDAGLEILQQSLRKAGIEQDTLLIVTADHGGHDRTHGTRSTDDMTIFWIAYGLRKGNIKGLVTTFDTAATALWALGLSVPESFDGKPVAEID